MKIIVIGYGYVGKAMTELLTNRYDLDIYDPSYPAGEKTINKKKITFVDRTESELKTYDLAIICTPTPMKETGECDLSLVEDAIKSTQANLFLIKSAVEPGTTDRLINEFNKNVTVSPEYVGESKYYTSYFPDKMIEVPFMIVGGKKDNTKKIIDIFLPILGPDKKYMQTTTLEAEIIKYMENTFFATKVTFCNEIYDLCEKVGADYHIVREGFIADPRVNPMHTAVFKNDRGFGGKCYPKDINALAEYMRKNGVDPILLDAVIKKNKKLRK